MSHIFISYSKQNKAYARKLADHLRSQGFEIWIDDRIDYGDTWERAIFKAIDECSAFLVIMTPESYASDWVLRECQYSDKRKKPQFPVLLDGEEFPRYVTTQYADARGEKLPGADFTQRLEKFAPRKDGQKEDEKPKGHIGRILDGRLNRIPSVEVETGFALPDVSSILPPPFEWCEIPAGKVTTDAEYEKITYLVESFAMAKYPITNAQYQVFVNAEDGYPDPAWWGYSDEAKLWRRENKQPQKTAFEGDDLSRTNVTWYEAVAFCQWLTSRINRSLIGNIVIMLPTEQQWQRAAQGDDGRKYPWGNEFNYDMCNTRDTNIWKPTPVTRYPNGASPYGVIQMSGNVWEWCLTRWGTSNQEDILKGDKYRILRGGSFGNDRYNAQCSSRGGSEARALDSFTGFRICAAIQNAHASR